MSISWRCALAFAVAVFCPGNAALSAPSQQVSLCDGRYEATGKMVDAAISRYGTLYSGGFHHAFLDDVGATVDLYRLWKGFHDLNIRGINGFEYQVEPWGLKRSTIKEWLGDALAIMEEDHPPSDEPLYLRRSAVHLDLGTIVGLPADWWRNPGGTAIGELARARPSLDWLQAVLAASDTPWSLAWHLDDATGEPDPALERMIEDALEKFHSGKGIEWAVVAQSLWQRGTRFEAQLLAIAHDWEKRVQTCQASPAEYAAHAVSVPVSARFTGLIRNSDRVKFLPPAVRELLAEREAMQAMFEGTEPDLYGRLDEISKWYDGADFASWMDVGRLYASSSADQLIEMHKKATRDPKAYRIFNLLPVELIRRIALATNDPVLVQAVFARLVALERLQEASALIPSLRDGMASEEKDALSNLMSRDFPEDAKLSLAVLRMRDARAWIKGGKYHSVPLSDHGLWLFDDHVRPARGLPVEFGGGTAVQGDYETWLRLPQKWHRYRGLGGYDWQAEGRLLHYRHPLGPDVIAARPVIGTGSPFGIAKLVALDEVEQLIGEKSLPRHVSATLVRWADEASDTWWKRHFGDKNLIAEALHRVVSLSRFDDCGEIEGVPVAKRAFKLLHKRFPDSEWARKTPYWYRCCGQGRQH